MATRTSTPAVNTTTAVAPHELNTYYKNARRGDIPTIVGSLKAHGQYKPLVVNIGTHTGRPNEVLAGNHTLMAMRTLAEQNPTDERWTGVLAHWVDVDDDRAARIVLVDNRSSEIGAVDSDQLYELICTLGGNIEGTGYTDDDVAALMKAVTGDGINFDITDDVPRLDEVTAKLCQKCGYDVANNKEGL